MFWSTKSNKTETPAGAAPSREDRERCWEMRDAYFQCLDKSGVLVPGKEEGSCSTEKAQFEANCVKSWIEHFNQRRVVEYQQQERQALMSKRV